MIDTPIAQLLALLLLLAAVYGLGRWQGARRASGDARLTHYNDDHMRGLNYLLNERPDEAIESFIASLAVNDDTVETHLALGALVRRKGEVDKAIRLHQNLLARPGLSRGFRAQAELELARDYLAAGLLGRAENLLEQLADRGGELRETAEAYLLEVHERGRDWAAAVTLARRMQRRGVVGAVPRLAHYLCEQAEGRREAGDDAQAGRLLEQALKADGGCVRASLAQARLAFDAGRYKVAVAALKRLLSQDACWLSEGLGMLVQAHESLGRERDLLRLLADAVALTPEPAAVTKLAERIAARDGEDAARALLVEQMQRQPSLAVLRALLQRTLDDAEGQDPAQPAVQALVDALGAALRVAPGYRCASCRLASRTLHWQCPGCKTWGGMRPEAPQLA